MDKRIEISDSDLALFEAIHRHGPLPTNYLHAFGTNNNFNSHQHRLTKLYNGTEGGAYLVRPPQQFASFYARYQPVVYDLNERSKSLLHERGKLSPFINRVDPFLHRLMSACVGASIELGCKAKGLTYIPRHDVLSKKGEQMELPLSQFAAQKSLVPDDLFGFECKGSYRFFAVEIDRNTESIERRKIDQNTFGKKLVCYIDAMKSRDYKEVWGIPNMLALTVTTNATHMQNMMAYFTKSRPKVIGEIFIQSAPTFGSNWRVPPILTDILEPWQRADGTTFDITKSAP
ncbi:MAG: hypothetical protein IPI73_02620 [Betaproteobacteria bacterium]|nr:hypothetical protein [Betaproteobacteria bacterium]